ncbi:MAG TPA: hypothetical protein VMH77_08600 [Steroidobacteraceae bacterium]|nr:hypothetical protein [Steroidobacteraceae bacterium]
MKTARVASLLGLAALPMLASAVPNPPAKTGPCDRACLQGFVDKYLDAMQAHQVSDDLFARNVIFTENGIRLPFGHEGLWYDMSGKGQYKFYVPDIETQQIAFIGTVRFGGKTETDGTLAAIALRLKIVDNKITQIEQLDIRPDNTASVGGPRPPAGGAGGAAPGGAPRPAGPPTAGGAAPAGAGAPRPAAPAARPGTGDSVDRLGKPADVFFETIPENKRATREELIKTANYYFSGLSHNDGKGYYPFTDDCMRLENGMQTTAKEPGACKKQFETGLKGIVDRVRDRRFVAVDRERGIVFAFAFFDHYRINWTWQLAELFKIEDGQIRRIEAVFQRAPFGIPSGWSTYEQSISEERQDVR